MCKKKMEDSKRFPDNLLMDFSLLLAMNHDLCGIVETKLLGTFFSDSWIATRKREDDDDDDEEDY